MTFLALFWSFLKIGIFGFGGGYAILALIENEVVDIHGWMTTAEFTDIVAISQATPGPIAINCATYVGYSATDSIIGSAIATFAVCLPSLIIASLFSSVSSGVCPNSNPLLEISEPPCFDTIHLMSADDVVIFVISSMDIDGIAAST
jgi:chromate transport protein ChrA